MYRSFILAEQYQKANIATQNQIDHICCVVQEKTKHVQTSTDIKKTCAQTDTKQNKKKIYFNYFNVRTCIKHKNKKSWQPLGMSHNCLMSLDL